MAMLAGPRRKQKVINLRAKNNAWSNDSTKFGQRMLEKMGWSSGKGLGAKENGIVEHVVARYKNDDRGLGFEDKNDQWTKHEDDFNSLLANLSNAEKPDEKFHSGVSLEVKSKKSKARVHYHKFTRGKDLTRYSEKDLANIFGKKSLKEKEKAPEQLQEDVQTSEQVFTEKGSMEDYFKSKLAKLKSKSNILLPKNEPDDNADYAFKGFSSNANESDENDSETHQHIGFSFYNNDTSTNKNTEDENINIENPSEIVDSQKIKKKKKKNKNKGLEENNSESEKPSENTENITGDDNTTSIEEESRTERKLKKKKKKSTEEPVEYNQNEEGTKRKKKKLKTKQEDIDCAEEPIHNTTDMAEENYVPKKKKKRKNKELNE